MNVPILKMVVAIVGIVIILSVVGIVYLVINDKAIPGTLETITVAGITGLLGLLTNTKTAP